jgi:ribonucleoside-diphosphate reductase alpha chain
MNGKYVPSLLAAIGDIIEQHFIHIGFKGAVEMDRRSGELKKRLPAADGGSDSSEIPEIGPSLSPSDFCPRCGSPSMIFQEGCHVCRNCGHSTCS